MLSTIARLSVATTRKEAQEVARPERRATFVWTLFLSAASALAAFEDNAPAALVAALCLALTPGPVTFVCRWLLLGLGSLSWALGPVSLIVLGPIAAASTGNLTLALRLAISLCATVFLSASYLFLLPGSATILPLASGGYLAVATVAAVLVGARRLRAGGVSILVGLTGVVFLLLDAGASTGWIAAPELTDPSFRCVIALLPVAVAAIRVRRGASLEVAAPRTRAVYLPWTGVAVGLILGLIVPSSPVSRIVFDESHGAWETAQGTFGSEDFGRSVNYTYTLLRGYAERLVGAGFLMNEDDPLPEHEAVFVIKMPTKPIGKTFGDRLETWVRDGGRLMVVADHTDLYDTAQHLNQLLEPRFGIRIAANAVYDARGMPNAAARAPAAVLAGRIDGAGALEWQTGTSLIRVPPGTVTLSSFGPSFTESGDYARPNRFGPFEPRAELPYSVHPAVLVAPVGHGSVTMVLDSTPWSSFSLFKEAYTDLFRHLVALSGRPQAIAVAGYAALVLGGFAVLLLVTSGAWAWLPAGLALGVTIGSHLSLGAVALDTPVEGRDYGMRVVIGQTGRTHFLRQLVGPGERNYARIVSAMAKYGHMPTAQAPGAEVPNLAHARDWLMIEPDAAQLPVADNVRAHVRGGGSIAVLFASQQATDPKVRRWLDGLGLVPMRVTGLSLTEDAQPPGPGGLLGRRGIVAERNIRTSTGAYPTSQLTELGGDALARIYTTRPAKFPRTAGVLVVGFAADQFSDDAIGEVWEGIQPGSLGRLREQQLAALLAGEEPPGPLPDNLLVTPPFVESRGLLGYVVLQDGKVVVKGTLPEEQSVSGVGVPSAVTDLPRYLADLRARSIGFIKERCPSDGKATTECRERLLGSDLTEWMVAWTSTTEGGIRAIELLHERRFSGLGGTWNVVFGD